LCGRLTLDFTDACNAYATHAGAGEQSEDYAPLLHRQVLGGLVLTDDGLRRIAMDK
jgi:hypothetical protein